MMMGSTPQIEAITVNGIASSHKQGNSHINKSANAKVKMRFRILKTLLLVGAWISFGMNFEVIGSTLEDLKLFLQVDYQSVSFNLVLRNIGYLVMVSFSGYIFDCFPRYCDLFMCLSSVLFAIPGLLIPITKTYWVSALQFFIQGVASSFYDLGGNQMILSLWDGISNSPINLMHAGYGVGAILAVQIAKPFIKFDPMDKYRIEGKGNQNFSQQTKNEELHLQQHIDIRVPYWISSTVALVISALFLLMQLRELRCNKDLLKEYTDEKKINQELKNMPNNSDDKKNFLKRLFFGKKNYKGHSLVYICTQIALITVVLFCLQGYLTILSKFMLTYLTKGPANFTIDEFTNVQSIFWLLFILSRVGATFAAFRLNNSNSLIFMLTLLAINVILTVFLMIPSFANASNKPFFWFNISLIGLIVAPAHPSMFMVAKHILQDYNSVIIALFSIGLGLSSVAFQELTGSLLDWTPNTNQLLGFRDYNSSYLIAHVLFVPAFFSFLLFCVLFIIYKKYSHLVNIYA